MMVIIMLILNRKIGESIILDDETQITVLEVQDGKVKLGIDAPNDIVILRKEVYDSVLEENRKSIGQEERLSLINILKKR